MTPRWTHEERKQLENEIKRGLSWDEIGTLHGRTRRAVQQEARVFGFSKKEAAKKS